MAEKRHRKRKDPFQDDIGGFTQNHIDESNWLISYADLMTLLMGFFLLMFATSYIDKSKFEVVRKEVAKYFGGKVRENPSVKKLTKEVNEIKAALKVAGQIDMKNTDGEVVLKLQDSLLFKSGAARIRPEGVAVVNKLVNLITAKGGIESIKVQGHTDDVPIRTYQFPSNWELSAARAATIIRKFQDGGIEKEKMVAQGFADADPIVPNIDEKGRGIPENRALNRRVIIKVAFGSNMASAKDALKSQGFVNPDGSTPAAQIQEQLNPETIEARMKAAELRIKDANAKLKEVENRKRQYEKMKAMEDRLLNMERKAQEAERKLKKFRYPANK